MAIGAERTIPESQDVDSSGLARGVSRVERAGVARSRLRSAARRGGAHHAGVRPRVRGRRAARGSLRAMAARTSAGFLLYRRRAGSLEVLLAHPGGPFWARRDEGAWTIPKGEPAAGEDLLAAARRELREEIGCEPREPLIALGSIVQRGGKTVHAWACESGYREGAPLPENPFEIEWPPRSGRRRSFPEIDRVGYFPIAEARRKILDAQRAFLDRLEEALRA
jgi:predicted NUDIX family NTP pyrophosphohydrolase